MAFVRAERIPDIVPQKLAEHHLDDSGKDVPLLKRRASFKSLLN